MTGIQEEILWCRYDSCQSHKTSKVFYRKSQFHRRASQQEDLPIAMEKSKCFRLKYKLALSIWNRKNLGWKMISSSKLRSISFTIFSCCRQLSVCNVFVWESPAVAGTGLAGAFLSLGYGQQSRWTKMSHYFLSCFLSSYAQVAAQSSVVWTYL